MTDAQVVFARERHDELQRKNILCLSDGIGLCENVLVRENLLCRIIFVSEQIRPSVGMSGAKYSRIR